MWQGLFTQFLRGHNLCSASDDLPQLYLFAFIVGDEVMLEMIEREFPGFSYYRQHLEELRQSSQLPATEDFANPKRLCELCQTKEQKLDEMYRSLPDEKFCAVNPTRFVLHPVLSLLEDEVKLLPYLLHWSDLRAEVFADIGCGSCHHLIFAKKMGLAKGWAIGLDASTHVLQVAKNISRRECTDVEFVSGNCVNLPFADGSIGQTWMISVLPWVLDWKRALDEIKRVLTPRGRAVMVINRNKSRCAITVNGAVAYLNQLGFRVDDITRVNEKCHYIAAGKK